MILTSIMITEDHSNLQHTPFSISISANIDLISTGNFSQYVKDGKLDIEKLSVDLLNGIVKISS